MNDNPFLIPVPVGACRCPGSPHEDGDTVFLYPTIGLHGGVKAQQAILNRSDPAALTADLTVIYVQEGIAAWTFTDDKEKAVPVTPENIESLVLRDFTYATPIADKADQLYTEAVLSPLRVAASKSSPRGPTNGSTSQPMASSPRRPKRPKPSSTSTTGTALPAA